MKTKVITIIIFFTIIINVTYSQGVAINTDGSDADASAILDISSTDGGVLIPRMTAAEIATISNPATGLMVFQTDGTVGLYYNTGTPTSPVFEKITVESDIDELIGTETGQMQYWDGTEWITVSTGCDGQVLTFSGGIPFWSGEFEFNGLTYGNVINPTTGEIWLDRNLGATQVATSKSDVAAYGDLYQWGRLADGHESRVSSTTSTTSSSDTPGHSNLITNSTSPYDWRIPQNSSLWQGINGINNPCPNGYRIPTQSEWDAERLSWTSNDDAGAFNSPLKLTVAGRRNYVTGSQMNVGSAGMYWSSSMNGNNAYYLNFSSSTSSVGASYRANTYSIRCIKD